MNNNAVFWMNMNNIKTNSHPSIHSNKDSSNLFDKVLKSTNSQSKTAFHEKDKRIFKNKLNDREIKLDSKSMAKEMHNSSKQLEKTYDSYDNINQISNDKSNTKLNIKDEERKNELETKVEEDMIQNDIEKLKKILLELDEVLYMLLNLNQESTLVDNIEQDVLPSFNSTELISKMQEISLQLGDLINHISIIDQAQILKFLEELQEMQVELNLLSKNNTEIQEEDYIPEIKNKINELLDFMQKIEKPSNNLSINTDSINDEKIKTEEDKNNKNTSFNKDTKVLAIKSEKEQGIISGIENKADLTNNNNNSHMQKPIQDVLINTRIENNNVSNKYNDFNTKVDNLQKFISLNKDSIFEQVVDKIKVNYNKNSEEVRIKLKPEILGEMTIKIAVEKGLVTAKAIVENYHIKQMLESNVDQLKESFKNEGLSFQALDVSVSKDSGFDRNDARFWTSKNKAKSKKIILDDTKVGSLYDDINNNSTNIMSMYSTSLDLIV